MNLSMSKYALAATAASGLAIMVAAAPSSAMACDVTSATDTSCGPATVNPANPLSSLNPSNPLSTLSSANAANPSSPLNPANQYNPYRYSDAPRPDLLRLFSGLFGGEVATPAAPAAYPPVHHRHHRRHRPVE